MGGLRYLCVSDLHLGASMSLMTHVDGQGRVSPDQPGPTLTALATALRATVARLAGDDPPTLVLIGDALDLGLSTTGEVGRAFLEFVDALFPANAPALFAPRLICMPGNHDHHLWRMAQDEQFVQAIENDGTMPHDLVQCTPLRNSAGLQCRLLTRLIRTRQHLAEAQVEIAYPNFAIIDDRGERGVILHHGHFIDAMYRSMSRLRAWLTDGSASLSTVDDIQSQNGAWIDFLWSDLGSAGVIGEGIATLYETMLDAGASHAFAELLSERLLAVLGKAFGVPPETAIAHGVTLAEVVRGLVDLTAGRAAESQRDGYRTVMGPGELADLRWYLNGPVAAQLSSDGLPLPRELAFVFGHTHKPFQDQIAIPPYKLPVSVYNIGGWVLDAPTMMACQGAAIVLIDDDVNIASVRLFNDPINGEMARVRVEGVGGFRDSENPLLADAIRAVAATDVQWAAFSEAALAAIRQRAAIDLGEFFHPNAVAAEAGA